MLMAFVLEFCDVSSVAVVLVQEGYRASLGHHKAANPDTTRPHKGNNQIWASLGLADYGVRWVLPRRRMPDQKATPKLEGGLLPPGGKMRCEIGHFASWRQNAF